MPGRLDAVSGRAVTVEFVTHHDSARSGRAFVRTKGALSIPAGSHIGHLRIPIVDDARHEGPERFWVELRDAHNARARDAEGFVWIGDDDG